MNSKFKTYFRENFFQDENDLNLFLNSLRKKLIKTLRVNTNKISVKDFKNKFTLKHYLLNNTFQDNVFYVERGDDFDLDEKRLGFSLEHLLGYFYIQELGASSSVFYLSEGKIDTNPFLILDMASSPGGKTTQLSEHYPNSFIVANEFDKNRTRQLVMNTERMGCDNIGITNYNGQFLGRLSNTFDKILLDAPCSGEGTGFKSEEALKFWNIKNVKKISDLQKKLFEAGLNSLKIGGEMLYSTCTMNKIENEGIVDSILQKHPGSFKIVFEKRFWPHIDETGGFFVCKIKKIKEIEYKISKKENLNNKIITPLNKNEEEILKKLFLELGINYSNYSIYKANNDVLLLNNDIAYNKIKDLLYFFKLGKKIGTFINNEFKPNYYIGRDFGILNIEKYIIKDENELDLYLKGGELKQKGFKGEFIQIIYDGVPIGLGETSKGDTIKNLYPKLWYRK